MKKLTFDEQRKKLTGSEVAEVQRRTGHLWISEEITTDAVTHITIAYLLKKRENPAYQLSEAEALTMEEIDEITGMAETERQIIAANKKAEGKEEEAPKSAA